MTLKAAIIAPIIAASLLVISAAAPAHAQEDREAVRANFQEADSNDDDQLDSDEFTTFINLNADDNLGRASTIRSLGMYGTAFSRADVNDDGFVTREEIEAGAGG